MTLFKTTLKKMNYQKFFFFLPPANKFTDRLLSPFPLSFIRVWIQLTTLQHRSLQMSRKYWQYHSNFYSKGISFNNNHFVRQYSQDWCVCVCISINHTMENLCFFLSIIVICLIILFCITEYYFFTFLWWYVSLIKTCQIIA